MVVPLPCSVQNFKKIGQMRNKLWTNETSVHDDVIKWKHFPRNWPFVPGIHRSPVSSPHKGQWRGALMFSLICVWINDWINNREAGDLRRYRAHYDVIVMLRCVSDGYLILGQGLLQARATRTHNLRIHAESSNHLSYQGQTSAVPCSWILALAV